MTCGNNDNEAHPASSTGIEYRARLGANLSPSLVLIIRFSGRNGGDKDIEAIMV